FIALSGQTIGGVKLFPKDKHQAIRSWYSDFSEKDAARIKEIETTTNHDVKAVEYFLKEKFTQHGWDAYKEFIHFGLTSQDINNTAQPLAFKEFFDNLLVPRLNEI